MRKNINKYLGLLVVMMGIIPSLALAAPGIPHQFYGTAKYTNGSDITSGNIIVKIGETQVTSVPISNGKYGYNPNLLLLTDSDNNRVGQTLKFFVGSIDTGQTKVFTNGGYTELNLTIVVPSDTVSGGGGGYTPTTAKKGDANGDGKVDKYDFSLMMSNWGKTGTNNSDFNADGKVDKYDFALLMSNWGL